MSNIWLFLDAVLSPITATILAAAVIVTKWLGISFNNEERKRLNRVLRRKHEERTITFSRMEGNFRMDNENNKKILKLGWDDLVDALQKRELTAAEVLEAYTAKALQATQKYNNITDFIPQATEWAKELDNLPEPKGPLHGIPFCVKDDNSVEGMDTTHGYAKNVYKPATETAVLVKTLMDLGAVPFCKTNVPQTLFTYGSDNPVFGCTLNATNPKLSPGGSSSGTGSLVGAHGCMFGTGTDIGGSLRVPAHWNGVCSIKPTGGRLSMMGMISSLPHLMGLTAVPGVIARHASIVATVFKGISENFRQHRYDPQVPPIPWDNELFESKEKLRIGYFTTLPFFPPIGDTEDIVKQAKSTLEQAGHTMVPFTLPDEYRYMRTVSSFLLADHIAHFSKAWQGEKVASCMLMTYLATWMPRWLQSVTAKIMECKYVPFLYSKRLAAMFGAGAVTSQDMWATNGEKEKIIEEVFEEWKRLKLDAVISPMFPFPAPPVSLAGWLPNAGVYSFIWNLVDFPAGVVQFGRESGKKINDYDTEGDNTMKMAKEGIKMSIGAPIAVQVTALPFKEETVLRLMCELEEHAKKHKK